MPETKQLSAALAALNTAVADLTAAGYVVRLQDGGPLNAMNGQGATVALVSTEPVYVRATFTEGTK